MYIENSQSGYTKDAHRELLHKESCRLCCSIIIVTHAGQLQDD